MNTIQNRSPQRLVLKRKPHGLATVPLGVEERGGLVAGDDGLPAVAHVVGAAGRAAGLRRSVAGMELPYAPPPPALVQALHL